MKVEAVDKRNPMLIRVATIADTEDHRLKVQDVSRDVFQPHPLCVAPLIPIYFSSLLLYRFTLMAGTWTMTTGLKQTAQICTQLDGARKLDTRYSTPTVRQASYFCCLCIPYTTAQPVSLLKHPALH